MATTNVDYRDFSLVFKAFHLKENALNGLICRCGLEKMDTFLSRDADFRELHDLTRDSFQIETIMVPTCDEDILSIEKLKKIFRDMSPYKRLVWCGRLLTEFHEENQCSRYLSFGLKFYLKAIEIYEKAHHLYNILPADMKIKELLRLSSTFRVHQSVFLELLRLFSTDVYYFRAFPIIDDVLLLEDIFRAANERKIDILVLWKKLNGGYYYNLFTCFVHKNVEAFIPLIKFGKAECISIESGKCLLSLLSGWPVSITLKWDYRYDSTTFRSLQILRLFLHANSKHSEPTTGPYALKLLWNSITEPFLCQEELKKSVIAIEFEHDLNVVNAAWDWYANHVLENVISPRGPRSLAHLSRCSARRQLATCLQLPCGVDQLDVPKILKDYILLEH
ncbi:uncharacterized protein [Parasteatoda tepidariorum]|nr:uncharacterized protein LOC107455891 [Parasteatoda tepidariorum]